MGVIEVNLHSKRNALHLIESKIWRGNCCHRGEPASSWVGNTAASRRSASGGSVHNDKPLRRDDDDGIERVAQYIIRNPFSEQKMVYNAENGTVIYRSRMHAKTKRNFEIFSAEEFIAAITQHIPDKGFQMVHYYGWYSNRARGERAKREADAGAPDTAGVEVIDVSEYQPRAFPQRSGAS